MDTPPFTSADIDAILFDVDGTLIDTDATDVSRWARRIAALYRKPEEALSAARRIVMAAESPTNGLFAILDWVGLDTLAVRAIIALGSTHNLAHIPPIHGVPELIGKLAGRYELGVISTRTLVEQETLLASLGIRQHFGVLVGRDTTWRIKPHPQPILHAARVLGITPGRCLMVGDTTVDVVAGRRAGAWTCGVLCGYGERTELENAGADVILEGTSDLERILVGAGV